MNFSFYSASVGAQTHEKRMQVLANNIANVNTNGFKAKNGIFTDLVYKNMNAPEDERTQLTYGVGVKMLKDDTDFAQGHLQETGIELDFALVDNGFFALQEPATGEISYTRCGSFIRSYQQSNGNFYLASANGKWVLDSQGRPITINNIHDDVNVGVFIFDQKNGMLNIGQNEFQPVEKNTPLTSVDGIESGIVVRGVLEASNVDFAKELSRVIESQRAYQMSLKMVQTSDEIANTINNLRS
ncbi:MAG: flagellar hook-basal body protein [Firmicutes bacterium]|nr:flagellar hook-basal body protein [Bacillota bacterium]